VLKKRIAVLIVVVGVAAGASGATGAGVALAKAAPMQSAGSADGSE
jgi:hypothetical protein